MGATVLASCCYIMLKPTLKAGNEALIISARDMDDKERKQYERK